MSIKRLKQTWLLSRFLLAQEYAPMPRGHSAAKQLRRTLCAAGESRENPKT